MDLVLSDMAPCFPGQVDAVLSDMAPYFLGQVGLVLSDMVPCFPGQVDLVLSDMAPCFPSQVDLVLSDMAPNATGAKDLDHDQIMRLAYAVANFAKRNGQQGSGMLCKVSSPVASRAAACSAR